MQGFCAGGVGRLVAASLLVGLAACGGGSGGSGEEIGEGQPPVSAVREVPLTITSANAELAATAGLGAAESLLMLGQMAVEWLDDLAASGSTRIDGPCIELGSRRVLTLVDRDGNGRPSPGDAVDVALFDHCAPPALQLAVGGTATIELAPVPSAGSHWDGELRFGDAFGNGTEADGQLRLIGALRFTFSRDRLAETLRVRSTATPFVARFLLDGLRFDEVTTEADAIKSVHRDTARARASASLRQASDVLGGAVRLSTVTPFESWFGVFPDSGRFLVSGDAASTVSVAARGAESPDLDLILNGGAARAVAASSLVEGLFWNGVGIAPPLSIDRYSIRLGSQRVLAALSSPPASSTVSQMPALVWQMNRPVVAAPAAFQVRGNYPFSTAPVPVAVEIEGALVTARPQTPLRAGVAYQLQLSVSEAGGPSMTLWANVTVPPGIEVTASVQAPVREANDYRSVLYDGGPARTLQVATTVPEGVSLASITWRQRSGPPVQFADPGATTTQVTIAPEAGGQAPAVAVIEVEVLTTTGIATTAELRLLVVAETSLATMTAWKQATESAYRVHAGAYQAPDTGTSYSMRLNASGLLDSLVGPRLFILPPAGTVWAPGMVWTIVRPTSGTTTRAELLGDQTYPGGPSLCEATSGEVRVSDLGVNGEGRLTRLALDYRFVCFTGEVMDGWVRLGTSVPPPG